MVQSGPGPSPRRESQAQYSWRHCSHCDLLLWLTVESPAGRPTQRGSHGTWQRSHLFSANQEVGAQVHWASEPWDGGSGGEKSQEEGAGFSRDSRCQQVGKAGDAWILWDATYSGWVPHPRFQGLLHPRTSDGLSSSLCTWIRDSIPHLSLRSSKDFFIPGG